MTRLARIEGNGNRKTRSGTSRRVSTTAAKIASSANPNMRPFPRDAVTARSGRQRSGTPPCTTASPDAEGGAVQDLVEASAAGGSAGHAPDGVPGAAAHRAADVVAGEGKGRPGGVAVVAARTQDRGEPEGAAGVAGDGDPLPLEARWRRGRREPVPDRDGAGVRRDVDVHDPPHAAGAVERARRGPPPAVGRRGQ